MNTALTDTTAAGIFAGILMLTAGCHTPKPEVSGDESVLVTVGDSSLHLDDVERRIPSGLAPEDSAELFMQIVDRWVESRVMEDVAKENVIDLERIDRMAESYRNGLIVEEYLRKMNEGARSAPGESEIKDYYTRHGDDLILTAPVIKGIYIKTSANDERLGSIRQWMISGTDEAVDNIEKYGMRNATQYEYFVDRWIDWNIVAEQIPYRFFDADAFLRSTKDFETTYGGSVYLLHISEYIPTGEKMPYEYAEGKISEILAERNSRNFRENLRRSLYNEARKSGRLRDGLYDAVNGRMKKAANDAKVTGVQSDGAIQK